MDTLIMIQPIDRLSHLNARLATDDVLALRMLWRFAFGPDAPQPNPWLDADQTFDDPYEDLQRIWDAFPALQPIKEKERMVVPFLKREQAILYSRIAFRGMEAILLDFPYELRVF